MKAENGISLNDTLFVGPKLQQHITAILLNFWMHAFVLVSNIKQVYWHILIDDNSRNYQQILDRFDPEESVTEYQLNTVTFGVTSSPLLALKTLQLANDEGQSFPLIWSGWYDLATGCDSVQEARVL